MKIINFRGDLTKISATGILFDRALARMRLGNCHVCVRMTGLSGTLNTLPVHQQTRRVHTTLDKTTLPS